MIYRTGTRVFTARSRFLRWEAFDLIAATSVILALSWWFFDCLSGLLAVAADVTGYYGLIAVWSIVVLCIYLTDMAMKRSRAIATGYARNATGALVFSMVLVGLMFVTKFVIKATEVNAFAEFDPSCVILAVGVLAGALFSLIQVIVGGCDSILLSIDRRCRDLARYDCARSSLLQMLQFLSSSEEALHRNKIALVRILSELYERVPSIVQKSSGGAKNHGSRTKDEIVGDLRRGIRLLAERIQYAHSKTHLEVTTYVKRWAAMPVVEWADDAKRFSAGIKVEVRPFVAFWHDCVWVVRVKLMRIKGWCFWPLRASGRLILFVLRTLGMDRCLDIGMRVLRRAFFS